MITIPDNVTSISISANRIVFRTGKPRRMARWGDIKWMRGKRYIRRQYFNTFQRAYEVRNGRPVWEWCQEDHPIFAKPPLGYKPRQLIYHEDEPRRYFTKKG